MNFACFLSSYLLSSLLVGGEPLAVIWENTVLPSKLTLVISAVVRIYHCV